VLGWCLWLGIPAVVGVAGTTAFLVTGWPAAVVGMILILPVSMIVAVLLMRRHGANVTGWDNENLRFQRVSGSEVVAWDTVEYFRKLWRTAKLDGNAWVAVLVKYRIANGHKRVLVTVSGTVVVGSLSLVPAHETVFDQRIPERNWSRSVSDRRQSTV
jgi:hypothetical protein